MFIKHFCLLILFILNISAGFSADFLHDEVNDPDTHQQSSESAALDKHVDLNLEHDHEHCSDHTCCHNHIHHYLPQASILKITVDSENYKFPDPATFYSLRSTEVIKPPLV
jgi:hypothetical protein